MLNKLNNDIDNIIIYYMIYSLILLVLVSDGYSISILFTQSRPTEPLQWPIYSNKKYDKTIFKRQTFSKTLIRPHHFYTYLFISLHLQWLLRLRMLSLFLSSRGLSVALPSKASSLHFAAFVVLRQSYSVFE